MSIPLQTTPDLAAQLAALDAEREALKADPRPTRVAGLTLLDRYAALAAALRNQLDDADAKVAGVAEVLNEREELQACLQSVTVERDALREAHAFDIAKARAEGRQAEYANVQAEKARANAAEAKLAKQRRAYGAGVEVSEDEMNAMVQCDAQEVRIHELEAKLAEAEGRCHNYGTVEQAMAGREASFRETIAQVTAERDAARDQCDECEASDARAAAEKARADQLQRELATTLDATVWLVEASTKALVTERDRLAAELAQEREKADQAVRISMKSHLRAEKAEAALSRCTTCAHIKADHDGPFKLCRYVCTTFTAPPADGGHDAQ